MPPPDTLILDGEKYTGGNSKVLSILPAPLVYPKTFDHLTPDQLNQKVWGNGLGIGVF